MTDHAPNIASFIEHLDIDDKVRLVLGRERLMRVGDVDEAGGQRPFRIGEVPVRPAVVRRG